jgi:hypothetical protein
MKIRPTCGCGNVVALKGLSKKNEPVWRSSCQKCHKFGRKQKKDHCERCNFIPEDMVQLDVDHIDGNRSNNDSSNIQTLCANCHRLKTKQNQDWKKKHEEV